MADNDSFIQKAEDFITDIAHSVYNSDDQNHDGAASALLDSENKRIVAAALTEENLKTCVDGALKNYDPKTSSGDFAMAIPGMPRGYMYVGIKPEGVKLMVAPTQTESIRTVGSSSIVNMEAVNWDKTLTFTKGVTADENKTYTPGVNPTVIMYTTNREYNPVGSGISGQDSLRWGAGGIPGNIPNGANVDPALKKAMDAILDVPFGAPGDDPVLKRAMADLHISFPPHAAGQRNRANLGTLDPAVQKDLERRQQIKQNRQDVDDQSQNSKLFAADRIAGKKSELIGDVGFTFQQVKDDQETIRQLTDQIKTGKYKKDGSPLPGGDFPEGYTWGNWAGEDPATAQKKLKAAQERIANQPQALREAQQKVGAFDANNPSPTLSPEEQKKHDIIVARNNVAMKTEMLETIEARVEGYAKAGQLGREVDEDKAAVRQVTTDLTKNVKYLAKLEGQPSGTTTADAKDQPSAPAKKPAAKSALTSHM